MRCSIFGNTIFFSFQNRESVVSERNKDHLEFEELLGIDYLEVLHLLSYCDFSLSPTLVSSLLFLFGRSRFSSSVTKTLSHYFELSETWFIEIIQKFFVGNVAQIYDQRQVFSMGN